MTDDEKRAAIEDWQKGEVRPLTCGMNSSHDLLEPRMFGGYFNGLVCPTCKRIQLQIPQVVFDTWEAKQKES